MPMADATLYDPARHEPLRSDGWSDAAARAAIRRIADDALAAFSPTGLWPAHALDEPPTPDTRYAMLYLGAGGIVWALQRLGRLGLAPSPGTLFDATVPTLVDRNRDEGVTAQGGTASYLMGDAGLLLLHWQTGGDGAVADRLYAVVEANLHHPALESLWGSPGTLLAAIHMAELTGERRWAELVERGLRVLLDQMHFDAETSTWLWQQDLYGRRIRYLGAAHGFVGNVYPALRASAWLPAELVAAFTERALQTLAALALHDGDGCINWHARAEPAAVVGWLPPVQDCHGAPGIVCRLADAPRTPAWDALLIGAGELTWRAGPLVKGPNLCHGTAGNGFAFLKLWTRTGDPRWLDRARAFAVHAVAQVEAERARRGHGRHSLWTGDVGVALYLAACLTGDSAFPTLDVF